MPAQYHESSEPLGLALLQRYALILLDECPGGSATWLREQVRAARTHTDLLKLRSAMFECISMHLGEAEAMDRIRSFDLSA